MTALLTPSQTAGPYLAIGLPWPDGPFVVAEGTPGAITITGVIWDGAGEPVHDALVETWQADPDGRFDHPGDPRGAAAAGRALLPRLRPLPDRPRRVVPHRHAQAGPAAQPGRRHRGAAHRRVGVRPRPARPAGDADLFPRRAGGEPGRPGAAGRRGPRPPGHADRRGAARPPGGPGGFRFDIHLQGDQETVFFDV